MCFVGMHVSCMPHGAWVAVLTFVACVGSMLYIEPPCRDTNARSIAPLVVDGAVWGLASCLAVLINRLAAVDRLRRVRCQFAGLACRRWLSGPSGQAKDIYNILDVAPIL